MLASQRFFRVLASAWLGFTLTLGGCGGGSSTPSPPPDVVAAKPTASFTAPTSAAANQAIVFDAGASTSSDGSSLSYSWDFGDGQRGGGKTIARSFATGGMRSVTLTVVDGAQLRDTQTRTFTVSAPVASGNITTRGRIAGLDGVALEGVAVAQVGIAGAPAATDAMGKVALSLDVNVPLVLKLSKASFADQFVAVAIPTSTGADAFFEAVLRARDAALTLADAAAGGSLAGRDGASITLPANALVNGAGTTVSGQVQIAMTPVDVTLPAAGGFPGSFDGIKPDATTTPIVSFGTVEFVLSSGVDRLQLAPGKTATIEVPIYAAMRPDGTVLAAGDTTPLWSLDEATSMWIQEGTGQVVASAASPSGLAMRATVSHFSWWNSDIGFDPYGPQPKCVYDTDSGNPGGLDTFATATVCNMLAEFDRGLPSGQSVRARALAAGQAAPVSPRVAGYSRRAIIPIAGGSTIPVPANVGIVLTATMLNASWTGRTVVNGPVGLQQQVLLKMRPIATTGTAPEPIIVPFDSTRSLQTGQTALYTFHGVAAQYARITASDPAGSNLIGNVRLLQGATALGSIAFGVSPGILVAALPANSTYTVELTGTANTPGAYRLQVELLGGLQSESLTFPFDVTKTLPAFASYRGSFSVNTATTAYFALSASRSVPTLLRVTGPNGAAVLSSSSSLGSTEQMVVPLPIAGTYTADIAAQDGQGGSFSVSGESTPWLPVAPGLAVTSSFSTIALVADRNGKPVVVYVNDLVVNRQNQAVYALRRWNGTAWENAASDLTVDTPCSPAFGSASIAFDSANNPLIVYGSTTASFGSQTTVRKFVAGAWAAVGPNGGVLPLASPFSSSCQNTPSIVIDAADRPMVAYRSGTAVTVQRFDGAAWAGLAVAAGDSFDSIQGGFDLRLDSGDQPYLALAAGGAVTVQRFNPAPGVGWEAVGPNGGRLPNVNIVNLSIPQLRFSAAGRPVIASVAGVPFPGSPGVYSAGVAVHRFDGTSWSTTGGYQTTNSYLINTPALAFAVSSGDAVVAWSNATRGGIAAPVVERNTAAGWTSIGLGAGEIPQYTAHGTTPDVSALDSRLVQIGSELYLTIIIRSQQTGVAQLILLRKVGD